VPVFDDVEEDIARFFSETNRYIAKVRLLYSCTLCFVCVVVLGSSPGLPVLACQVALVQAVPDS